MDFKWWTYVGRRWWERLGPSIVDIDPGGPGPERDPLAQLVEQEAKRIAQDLDARILAEQPRPSGGILEAISKPVDLSTACTGEALTLNKLKEAMRILDEAYEPPPRSWLWVHSLAEARRLLDSMGFGDWGAGQYRTDSFAGIPIKASHHIRSGRAILIVEDGDHIRVCTMEVPD